VSDRYLILENGSVFKGESFGYDSETVGELVFTTSMTGYMETLSDPAYFGQIVLSTFPLIGNCGFNKQDFGTGLPHLKAYIVREWCREPSNFRSEGNLDIFLRERKIPGLCGIDTRALASMIREKGTINAMVSKTPELNEGQRADLHGYSIKGAVAAVCDDRTAVLDSGPGTGEECARNLAPGPMTRHSGPKIVLWDFGGAYRLAERFMTCGVSAVTVRYDTTADEINALGPDGVVLSGGPGDPSDNKIIIAEIKKLCDAGPPILGVGLGHQMLAIAQGAKSEKLLFGHRGSNQPVKELKTGRVFVTSQNHGYVVSTDSLPDAAIVSHINLSDKTCEGITYNEFPALSVQFTPTDEIITGFLAMADKKPETGNQDLRDLKGY